MLKFLLGDPIKKLERILAKIQENAMHAQRNGNMALYAELSSEADEIYKKILVMKKEKELSS
jgi:hypothetical protein